jgi:hypothetical protein
VLLRAPESARLTGSDSALFHALEQVRLDACTARGFPGIHRDMATLRRELDEQGADYLPHLYGPANFAVIADVAKRPLKVSDIYRKLTS